MIGSCFNTLQRSVVRIVTLQRISPMKTVSSLNVDSSDLYVSANRQRFYKIFGTSCILYASAWSILTVYLMRSSQDSWEERKADSIKLYNRFLHLLHSYTPEFLHHFVITTRETLNTLDTGPGHISKLNDNLQQSFEKTNAADSSSADNALPLPDSTVETSDKLKAKFNIVISNSMAIANRLKESLGIVKRSSSDGTSGGTYMIPYLSAVMVVFTVLLGSVVPRRVIRRISILPHVTNSADPLLQVTTYGHFGITSLDFSLCVPASHIFATAPFSKSDKFMNLKIQGRTFVFYLEKNEAEFILPDYLDHLVRGFK